MTTTPITPNQPDRPLNHDLLLANERNVIGHLDRSTLEQRYIELVAMTLSIQESTKDLVGTLLLANLR